MLHMKFELPTSNIDISRKNKNDKTLEKNYNISHFENMYVLKMYTTERLCLSK